MPNRAAATIAERLALWSSESTVKSSRNRDYRDIPSDRRPPGLPTPCPRHGYKTRQCQDCDIVSCWACNNDAQPLGVLYLCPSCMTKRHAAQQSQHNIIDATKFSQQCFHGAKFRDTAKPVRPRTQNKKSGIVARAQQWAARDCGYRAFVDEMLPELLVDRFIELRMLGEHDIICPEGPVLASTIEKDLAAMRSWRDETMTSLQTWMPDTTETLAIDRALQFAKDNCILRKPGRIPPAVFLLLDFVAEFATHDITFHREAALYILGLVTTFLRPTALVSTWFDPVYLLLDTRTQVLQTHQVTARFERLLFFLDEDGDAALRILPTPGTEKNAPKGPLRPPDINPEQARSISTTRFVTNRHFLRHGFVDLWHSILTSLHYSTPGPLLRRPDNPSLPWCTTQFCAVYRLVEAFLGFPDKSIGSAECRAAMAMELIERGVPKEYVRMLGYWWSDAARIYEGAAQLPRLRTQKASLQPWTMPGPHLASWSQLLEAHKHGVALSPTI